VKLFTSFATLLFSVSLSASCLGTKHEEKLSSLLQAKFSQNPSVSNLKVEVIDSKVVPNSFNVWKGVKLKFSGKFTRGGKTQPFEQTNVFFTDGCNFTETLSSLEDGTEWKSIFQPKVGEEHYNKKHLIYGNADAKHKVVIFSDPLCPYCQRSIPALLDYAKNYPKTFAIYYYHLPLQSIHPASVPLSKLMYLAQIRGQIDAIGKAYSSKISGREYDNAKIVEAFNDATGQKYTVADLDNKVAVVEVENDMRVADELEVRGTPTIYLDGKKVHGEFYKDVKKVD
jgi:thiol:disulfide interchange protein DsbC